MQFDRDSIMGMWRDLAANWRAFLATHVLATLLGYVILVPMVSLLFNCAVSLSGNEALSDQQILFFALSPAGLISLLLIGSLGIAVLVFKHAALMTIAYGVHHGYPLTFLQALVIVVRRSRGIARLGFRIILRLLLYVVPFLLVLALTYRGLLSSYDINFYLADKPRELWIALALAAASAALLAFALLSLAVGWIYALPLLLFNRATPSNALKESRVTALVQWRKVLAWLLAWGLLDVLLLGLGATLVGALGGLLVPHVLDSIRLLVASLGLLLLIATLLGVLTTAASASMLAILVVRLYTDAGLDRDSQLLRQSLRESPGRLALFNHRRIVVACVLALIVAGVASKRIVDNLTLEDTTVIVAHRGAAAVAPENTLAAIERALDAGSDWVEIDVQETADGEVVVLHDSDLKKIAGVDLKIWDATMPRLAEIDIGSHFDPRFAAERVPTLREVLDVCRGRAGVIIELKYYGHNDSLEERVAAIVEATGMEDHIWLMSLDYEGLQRMRRVRPEWTLGLLTSVTAGKLSGLDVDFYAINARFGTRQFIERSQENARRVLVWTINDAIGMSRMMSRGVDGIITDDPALARDVLAQRASLSAAERLLIELATFFGHEPDYVSQ